MQRILLSGLPEHRHCLRASGASSTAARCATGSLGMWCTHTRSSLHAGRHIHSTAARIMQLSTMPQHHLVLGRSTARRRPATRCGGVHSRACNLCLQSLHSCRALLEQVFRCLPLSNPAVSCIQNLVNFNPNWCRQRTCTAGSDGGAGPSDDSVNARPRQTADRAREHVSNAGDDVRQAMFTSWLLTAIVSAIASHVRRQSTIYATARAGGCAGGAPPSVTNRTATHAGS